MDFGVKVTQKSPEVFRNSPGLGYELNVIDTYGRLWGFRNSQKPKKEYIDKLNVR